MNEITVKSLFRDDLQRFKMARAGATLAGVRDVLVAQHKGVLPENFVIKYEWGAPPFFLRDTPAQKASATSFRRFSRGVCAEPVCPWRAAGKGLQELTADAQLDAVMKTLEAAGNSSPLRLYLSPAETDGGEPEIPETDAAQDTPRTSVGSASTSGASASPRTPAMDVNRRTPAVRAGVRTPGTPPIATTSSSAPCE